MREIKFKIWWKGKIWEVASIEKLVFEDGHYLTYNGTDEPVVFVQYTGLKDKNGKEVYEGDVIKLYDQDTFIVEYNYDSFKRKSIKGVFYPMITDYGNMEVIGNIYENPELFS